MTGSGSSDARPPPPAKPPDPPMEPVTKKVSFQVTQDREDEVDCSAIVNRVLKSVAQEPKEQQLSAKAVDCHDSIEGQALRLREQINDRNKGLRHAQELFGKFGPACYVLFLMVVSREWIDAWSVLQMMIIVGCSCLQGMSKESPNESTIKAVRLDARKSRQIRRTDEQDLQKVTQIAIR